MDLATSGKGGLGPFIGICAISGAFGIADAHVQGGMVGDLSFMQPELLQVNNATFHGLFIDLSDDLSLASILLYLVSNL